MRASALALVLALPTFAGCFAAIDDLENVPGFPHGTLVAGLDCPEPVAIVKGPQITAAFGETAPHALEYTGAPACVLWRGGVVKADVASLAIEPLFGFSEARVRFLGLNGSWSGDDGRQRSFAGESATLVGAPTLAIAGAIAIERGNVGGFDGTKIVVEMPAAENAIVAEGGETRAPIRLELAERQRFEGIVLDRLGRGTLEVVRAEGLAVAGGRLVAAATRVDVQEADVAWTLGSGSGWRVGELPIPGDLQVVGQAEIVAGPKGATVDATTSEFHHALGPALETSVTLEPVDTVPRFVAKREQATAIWLAAREVSAVGQAYGVKTHVAAAEPALRASTGHWFDDPAITLLDVPELIIRNFLNAATLFFLDDALRTTTIPPKGTLYVPLYVNATAPPGDYTVDVGLVNPSGKPVTTRVAIRVEG
ncbi:MAG TPA: hypothetical protein VM889_02370 [Candidatus Thermoplasmatota archaeon]|nr:hypothetical protein [Candidatus Thermoplasmatota archaeon]